MRVTLKPRRVVRVLGAIVTLLTLADAAVLLIKFRLHHDHLFGLTPFFDFNREGNAPAFYSACALLFAAALLLVIAGDARQRAEPWHRHWRGLGLIFVFLGIDEAVEIHGLLTEPIGLLIDTPGPLIFAWVIPYAILTVVFVLVYAPFTWSLPAPLRRRLVLAGIVYVAGALGMELVGAAIVSAQGGVAGGGLEHWAHAVAYTIEEALEMIGVIILIHALLRDLEERGTVVSLRIGGD